VEREVEFDFTKLEVIRLALRSPDFSTAALIETAINTELSRKAAVMLDAGTIALDLRLADQGSPARVISVLENLLIEPQTRARVIVDQRSGTIVMGEDVRISKVAIAQGNLTLRVQEAPVVVQPNPFSDGETIVVPRTSAELQTDKGTGLAEVNGGTSLSELVAGLNTLGVAPNDMIDILKSINAAGALHAEFIVN
jgi:flagellar P-ring protein precursor FlgI